MMVPPQNLVEGKRVDRFLEPILCPVCSSRLARYGERMFGKSQYVCAEGGPGKDHSTTVWVTE